MQEVAPSMADAQSDPHAQRTRGHDGLTIVGTFSAVAVGIADRALLPRPPQDSDGTEVHNPPEAPQRASLGPYSSPEVPMGPRHGTRLSEQKYIHDSPDSAHTYLSFSSSSVAAGRQSVVHTPPKPSELQSFLQKFPGPHASSLKQYAEDPSYCDDASATPPPRVAQYPPREHPLPSTRAGYHVHTSLAAQSLSPVAARGGRQCHHLSGCTIAPWTRIATRSCNARLGAPTRV